MRLVAQRVAGGGVLQLGHHADLAGAEGVHVLLRLALQPRDVAHPLLGAPGRIEQRGIAAQGAGVHPEERELAEVGIRQGLEHQRTHRGLGLGGASPGLLGLEVGAADLGPIGGGRELVDDEVEQRVAADAPGGRAAQHRHDLALRDAGSQRLEHLGLGQRALLEILGQEIVVGLGGGLDQLLPPLLHAVGGLGRHRLLRGLAVGEQRGLLGDEIDVAAEPRLLADRNVHGHDAALEPPPQRVQRAEEVGALAVESVDDDRARQLELRGELPDLLGLHLDAGDRVDDHHRRLDDGEAGPGVGDEVAVPGRVDEVDVMALVVAVRHGRVDRDLPLDLVGVEVGGGGAVIHLAQSGDGAGREQHGLDHRGLAHPAMTNDTDVAELADFDRH